MSLKVTSLLFESIYMCIEKKSEEGDQIVNYKIMGDLFSFDLCWLFYHNKTIIFYYNKKLSRVSKIYSTQYLKYPPNN